MQRFEKNILKMSVFGAAILFLVFLSFLFFSLSNILMGYKFIAYFVAEANVYPSRLVSVEGVLQKNKNKVDKAEIKGPEVKDIFVVQ